MEQIFKDKAKEEGASVTDLVLLALQLLREDIREVIDFIKPVELQNKGQPNYVESLIHKNIETWKYI